MAQLKRWESPRREGRNHKGRGGSARQRQLIKRQKQLQKKLKQQTDQNSSNQGSSQNPSQSKRRELGSRLLLWLGFYPSFIAVVSSVRTRTLGRGGNTFLLPHAIKPRRPSYVPIYGRRLPLFAAPFPKVHSYEAFKYLHMGLMSEIVNG